MTKTIEHIIGIKEDIGKLNGKIDGIAKTCSTTTRHLEKINGHIDNLTIKSTKNEMKIKGLDKNWKLLAGIVVAIIPIILLIINHIV